MTSSSTSKTDSTDRRAERRLRAADKMANAVSRFYNRYMRGANVDRELDEMKQAKNDYWDENTTEPNFSRENEDYEETKGKATQETNPEQRTKEGNVTTVQSLPGHSI